MLLIGFGHKRRRGKDRAADFAAAYLAQKYSLVDIRKETFAQPLREGVGKHLFRFTWAQIYGDDKNLEDKFWGLTPRKAMQLAGDVLREGFGPDVLLRSMERRLLGVSTHEVHKDAVVLVSDVRMQQEFDFVHSKGGVCIRVDRDMPDDDDHVTERGLDNAEWDYVLNNKGSLVDLQSAIRPLMDEIWARYHTA